MTRDPWECNGFRAVPCADVHSVWVEIEPPRIDRAEPFAIQMSPDSARELAGHLIRVADTTESWRREHAALCTPKCPTCHHEIKARG